MRKLILSGSLVLGVCFLAMYLIFWGDSVINKEFSAFPLEGKIIFVWGYGGDLILWLWMLIDCLKQKELKHRVFWGLALFFMSMLACLVYWLFVYMPRHLKTQVSQDASA